MSRVAIPPWTATGVIAPVDATNPAGPERSPYVVSLSELVLRFATSEDRRRVLDGFLRYRGRLHAAGLVTGFQWLDGSFLEHIEVIEDRPPKDLDVVTFFCLLSGTDQSTVVARAPDAFPRNRSERLAFKSAFFVDPYFVDLTAPPGRLVRETTYWYSMWSHRRDASWKGYLQIDLAPDEDNMAVGHLTILPSPGGMA